MFKSKEIWSQIGIGITLIGLTFYLLDPVRINKRKVVENQPISILQKSIIDLQEDIKQKEYIIETKFSIIKQAEKIIPNHLNEWSVIFSVPTNNHQTIKLYGTAIDLKAKQKLISKVSHIPEIFKIEEHITVVGKENWPNYNLGIRDNSQKELPIRSNVIVISEGSESFNFTDNLDEDTKTKFKINDSLIKAKIEQDFFEDKDLYKEVVDIKLYVSDTIAEVRGYVNDKSTKDRVEEVLKKFKVNGQILTYNNALTYKNDN